MRLSDVLSKPISDEFQQVEGFLENRKLGLGKQKKIVAGKVGLNYFCKECSDDRTFCSNDELFCVGVSDFLISIDCVLKCSRCDASVQTWFLVESKESISSSAPVVRILKRSEKLPDSVSPSKDRYGEYSELLEKAERAYRDELGAGAVVYLRKILENITTQTAEAADIDLKTPKGTRKAFKVLLKEVDEKCLIIPSEFSAEGYKLFGELSNVLHGNYNELDGLKKFHALHRLVVGVIENVKNNKELMSARGALGWDADGGNEQ